MVAFLDACGGLGEGGQISVGGWWGEDEGVVGGEGRSQGRRTLIDVGEVGAEAGNGLEDCLPGLVC